VTAMADKRDRDAGRIGHRTAFWLAWSLCALSIALTGSALLLVVLGRSSPNAYVFEWLPGNAIVIDAIVGAIIASRRPENPVGWLVCLASVVVSTSTFASQYAIEALLVWPGSLPAGEAAAWVAAWTLPVMIGFQIAYLSLFPTGRLPSRRWRPLVWLTLAFVLLGVFLAAFASNAYMGALGPIRNPLAIEGFDGAYKAFLYVGAPALHVAVAVLLFVRLRRSVGVERQQLKWFAYAVAALTLGIVLNIVSEVVDIAWFTRVATVFFTLAGTGIPISIGIAILRYRLYDIDLLINRTLVYGSLSVTLIAFYFGAVVVLQRLFVALTGQQSTLATIVATLAIAALFNPLRRRIQSFIDRRFYRKRYDMGKTLDEFSFTLRDETDIGALGNDLVGVVRETMQPAHVSVWLRSDPAPRGTQAQE
jgi:hypothetical protein